MDRAPFGYAESPTDLHLQKKCMYATDSFIRDGMDCGMDPTLMLSYFFGLALESIAVLVTDR
jgi:hypothetical protein